MFYSALTGWFYHAEPHCSGMPSDVIDVGGESHNNLLAEQGCGKVIIPDENGFPVYSDADSTDKQLRHKERSWRDAVLSSVEWLRERHRDQKEVGIDATLPSEHFKELLVYMQALRHRLSIFRAIS